MAHVGLKPDLRQKQEAIASCGSDFSPTSDQTTAHIGLKPDLQQKQETIAWCGSDFSPTIALEKTMSG